MAAHSGDVELVIEFLNTFDLEEGTDVLLTRHEWHAWAHDRHLTPDPLPEAMRLRAGLRAAIGDDTVHIEERPGEQSAVPVGIVLTEHGPDLTASTAAGAVFAAAARIAIRGDWRRFKICPAHTCRWAFFDNSRNRSRTWCSMAVCGNREKARAFRKRSGGDATRP
ncbi:CGNR zinc finger domain-containing protein [Prauserella marina]|uniref:CGNR zinc finger domain-containing protein n=1 Tax=Prauserella marina TaxID=530584 RepID=UPI001FE88146|nr:CGNR zinc finger domain-containing protein [Prauserella marina]